MHSTVIIVESMSATSSRLRRPSRGWTTTSTPGSRPSSAARAAPGSPRARRSQALPSSTQSMAARRRRARPAAAEISPRASRSFAIRVAMNMASSGKPPLALIAGPTASGKSALALALAEQAGGIGDQRRQRPGLSRPAHRLGPAERGGRGAGAAPALRLSRRRRRLLGGGLGRRTPRRRSPRRMRRAGCRSWSAAPASISAP